MNKTIKIILIVVLILVVGIVLIAIFRPGNYEEMKIVGDTSKFGNYDPSMEYGDDGVGWLSYSELEYPCIHNSLAKTTDQGATWSFVSTLNECKNDTVIKNGQTINVLWRQEVSNIVYDPDDKGKEWKAYYHKYSLEPPYTNDDMMFKHGWIVSKVADTPENLANAEEIPLFAAGDFTVDNYDVKINLNNLSPELKEVLWYTEIGSVYHDGVLYLSVEGYKVYHIKNGTKTEIIDNMKKIFIFLIASYDHGETWNYIGKLTDFEDSKSLGYLALSSSSIVEEDGRIFLILTPLVKLKESSMASEKIEIQEYFPDGTMIFEFDDIKEAKLKRDSEGKLLVIKYLKSPINNGGHSAYDEENINGGILMPQVNRFNIFQPFKLYNTKEKILKK